MTPVEYLTYLKHSNSPQDIVSLIYLRASKGLIKIVETEGESIADSNNPISVVFNAAKNLLGQKENHIVLQKEKGATMEGMKEHEKILYRALFDGRDEVDITMEKDLYISLEDASDQVNSEFKYKKLYTPESTSAMRKMIFMLIGLIVFAI